MLNSTKLKEIYLFEMGEIKSLKLVKQIYQIFKKPGRLFDTVSVIIHLVDLEGELSLTRVDGFNYAKFVSKEFKRGRDSDSLIIKVRLI